MENENVNIWNKKFDELTVKETIKFTAVATAVSVVAPVVVMGVLAGAVTLYDRIRNRKQAKLEIVKTEE